MRIKEIVLETNRLHEMKLFYSELLEFPILEESADSLSVQAGESKMTFQNSSAKLTAYYHFAFTIPDNKSDEAGRWLQHKGISLYSKDDQNQFYFEDWNATASYFYDPQGNLVEFIAHHSLNNSAELPFEQNSILHISEIGLPVHHVAESSKRICEAFSQEVWRGDGKQFAAIGDANGLFIVVDIKRPWFPDARMPHVSPTQVKIQGESGKILEMSNLPYQFWSTLQNF